MTIASNALKELKMKLGLPVTTAVGGEFVDAAPFVQSFQKGERIYKIADLGASASSSGSGKTSASPGLSNIEDGHEDWTLSLADAATSMATPVGRRTVRGVMPPPGNASTAGTGKPRQQKGFHATGAKQLGWGQRGYNDHRSRQRESSVRIEASWSCREEIEFARLSKLAFDPEDPQLVAACGSLPLYNKAFDRLTTKSSKSVLIDEAVAVPEYATLAADPIIRDLAGRGVSSVFMSDVAAAVLMAAPRSVSPWDLLVTWECIDGKRVMFVDQRPGSQLHYTPVGETLSQDLIEEASSLSLQASKVNSLMPSLIANEAGESIKIGDTQDSKGAAAYKYFEWTLDEDDSLVIRSTLNCANRLAGREQVGLVCALYDCTPCLDPSYTGRSNILDWRSKLDIQRGAVLAGEIKNNNAIIARWVFQAYLAQADLIKLAYVSRVTPKDRVRHELLGLQDLEPYELAVQMSLDPANGFGILKALVDLLTSDSIQVSNVAIVRDPIKPIIRLYDM